MLKISRRDLFNQLGTGLVAGHAASQTARPAARQRPNIVLILADYMGYSDTEPYGARDIRTPNLSRLAAQGLKLTDAYASAPICAPSRAALLSGRYQERFGLEANPGPDLDDRGLPASAVTVAQRLKRAGYATAMIGKWHLGFGPEFGPNAHGFDESLAFYEWSIDYFSHRSPTGKPGLYENAAPVDIKGYSTDIFTDRAVSCIGKLAKKPFFLYVAYNASLPPIQPPGHMNDIRAKDAQPVPKKIWEKATRQDYIETVEALDAGIGRILDALQKNGLADDTLVVFTYDHGGMGVVRNAPLARGFATLSEGGIRVPCILRWPGHLPAGKVSGQPVIHMDLAATFLAAANGSAAPIRDLDGINLLPVLNGTAPIKERTFFWRSAWEGKQQKAVRKGHWKYLKDEGEHLFDLHADISETRNLAREHPGLLAELRRSLAEWEKQMPPATGR